MELGLQRCLNLDVLRLPFITTRSPQGRPREQASACKVRPCYVEKGIMCFQFVAERVFTLRALIN